MTALIATLTRLSMRFGGIVAVHELDFAVEEGELVGLIGPNGCGKTTTINMLTGHLTPVGGRILLRGHPVEGMPAHKFAAGGVGRTFQITQLFGRMSVLENMLVPGLARRGSTFDAHGGQARLHLEFLGLAALENLPAKNLSGGQQKLLELGRALMLEPTIMFLDEPFAGVNPFLRDEIIGFVQALHAQGTDLRGGGSRSGSDPAPGEPAGGDVARREDRRRHAGGGARRPRGAARLCGGLRPMSSFADRSQRAGLVGRSRRRFHPLCGWKAGGGGCAQSKESCRRAAKTKGPKPWARRYDAADGQRTRTGGRLCPRHPHPARHVGRCDSRVRCAACLGRTAPASRRC